MRVITEDGLRLYVEVDAAEPADAEPLTVVFVHGHALTLDCWHFQRRALLGEHRLVSYDQRSHGRSERSDPDRCTIDQLGRDLSAVIDQVSPVGSVVLIGHSMGGMAIMAMAEQFAELFAERVAGVGLVATSAGNLSRVAIGLPGLPGRVVHRVAPSLLAALARAPRLVESSRRAGSDLGHLLTRRYAFGGDVPDDVAGLANEMLAGTPIGVIADFFPGFSRHDRYAALAGLRDIPTLILAGTADLVTPIEHSRRLAEELSFARLRELPGAGHLVMLERPDEVSQALRELLARAGAGSAV